MIAGGTAGALRYELGNVGTNLTTHPLGHAFKAVDQMLGLSKLLESGGLNALEKSIADAVFKDIGDILFRVFP
jgi:hypothetical protein